MDKNDNEKIIYMQRYEINDLKAENQRLREAVTKHLENNARLTERIAELKAERDGLDYMLSEAIEKGVE